jgi:predicted alpha/beta hydrolase family esterase
MKEKLILFVHGLGGDGKSTWRGFPNLIQDDEYLNSQFDVEFYQYPTWLFSFFGKTPKIQDLARGLRTQINHKYSEYKSIVLVCHSLGGLIARMYLIEEVKNQRPLKINKLLLYAVPNNGAGLASVAQHIAWRHNQLAQLSQDSDLIEFLNQDWFRLKIGNRLSIKYIVAGQDSVVERDSAESFWGNLDIETIIDKGHINIVKPKSAEDLAFVILKNFVDERRITDVAVDLSHRQREQGTDGWRGFPQRVTDLRERFQLTEPGSLKNRHLIDRISTLVLALPYQSPFSDDEAKHIRMWVENGGSLFLMGYYAADTHHSSNPSRIAGEFGFRFRDDLVMPGGASADDCRKHVFNDDERLAVQIQVSDNNTHLIVNGIKKLAFMSSCSIETTGAPKLDFILKSPDESGVWHPEGPKGPEGWSRKIIERWMLDRNDAVPLLVAFTYGKGRVILSGTWKLCTLPYGDNTKMVNNILQWLSTKSM